MPDRKVELAESNPEWPLKFEIEKEKLRSVLGSNCIKVHHVGSTAIKGIIAKPIIDILVEVHELEKVDEVNSDMQSIGYTPKGENGIPGRRYFQKEENGKRVVHAHIVKTNDIQVRKHLAFCNGMNGNPALAKEYEQIKQAAILQAKGRSGEYQDLKSAFIEAMTSKFMKEKS